MGFGLRRTFKKVKNVASGLVGGLLGAGGRPEQAGPANPFAPPDLDKLLSNKNLFGEGGQFAFLNQTPGVNTALAGFQPGVNTALDAQIPGLTGRGATFADMFQETESQLDPLFQDLLGSINAPSSIEEVQRQIEEGQLEQVLDAIGREGEQELAATRGELAERGLSGPGQMSDIEANALAQIRTGTGRTKAGARTDISRAQIERLRDREKAKRDAFGRRFDIGAQREAQLLGLSGQGALTDVSNLNQLLGLEFQGGLQRDIARSGVEESGLDRSLQLALAQSGVQESGLARDLQRQLAKAGILQERDITKAKTLADLFTGGASREIAGRKPREPGFLENLLGNLNVNVPLPIG